jgi:flavodoxin I
MKAIILYDSLYGNTEKIAQIIGNSSELRDCQVIKIGNIKPDMLLGTTLLVVGSPTQQFRPTKEMTGFLSSIPNGGLKGIKVAAFDTRLTMAEIEKSRPLPFFVKIFGYAAERIAKQLQKKGGKLLTPAVGFYVQGMKGPLEVGEQERAEEWAKQLANLVGE